MKWGRRKRQISPDKFQEQQQEKPLSFLSSLLSKLLCICNPCSSPKELNQPRPKPLSPKPDPTPEPKSNPPQNPKPPPGNQARSIRNDFEITKRSKIGYKPPNHHGPAIIYGLDPTVRSRRSKDPAVAKVEEKDLEGFAVAKKSSDPERDFKESMVRMIRIKRICRPDDLENLLACYLVLNSDEYHDVIVKVFRQIWVEISSDRLRSRRPVQANRRG